jgi:hypothetical protein
LDNGATVCAQLRKSGIDFLQMFLTQFGYLAARRSSMTLQIKNLLNLSECEPQRLRFLYESHAPQGVGRVETVVSF